MQIRIRKGKKMDPVPSHKDLFKINWFFLKQIFLSFFTYLYATARKTIIKDKFWEPKIFSLSVFGRYFVPYLDPWIRIFLRIRTHKAKMLQIQRIWIRSTGVGNVNLSFKSMCQCQGFARFWLHGSGSGKCGRKITNKTCKKLSLIFIF